MSWGFGWPPTTVYSPPGVASQSTDSTYDKFFIRIWQSLRQKSVAAGFGPFWPKPNMAWWKGTITDATVSTITDATATWDATGTFSNPWVPTNNPSAPGSWSIVIDDCDYRRIIHVNIQYISTSVTVVVDNMQEMITDRTITQISDLIGKHYYILRSKGTDNGLWWHERIPQWATDRWFDSGVVASSHVAATTTITAATNWTTNQWAGYDVMYRDATELRRGVISSNSSDTLSFPWPGGGNPTGDFYIVAHDAYFPWGRSPSGGDQQTPSRAYTFYRGPTESYWSHLPDDTIGFFQTPQLTDPLYGLDIYTAGPYRVDFDILRGGDELVDPDKFITPHIQKTLRQVCCEIIKFAPFFIKDTTFDFREFKPSPYVPATLFWDAGVNAQEGTTGTPTADGLPISGLEMPWTVNSSDTIPLYYAIFDKAERGGRIINHGVADFDGTKLVGAGWQIFDTDQCGITTTKYLYANRLIRVSFGFTWWLPREVKYFFGKTGFIPSQDPITLDVTPVPDSDSPGQWIHRGASISYLDRTTLGFATTGLGPKNDFVTGDYVRLVGDSWSDPFISPTNFLRSDQGMGIVEYHDHFYTGKHPESVQKILDAQLIGTATGGDTRSLIDTSKDWWTTNWYSGGVNRTETGICGAGSNTIQIVDASKIGDGLWDSATGRWQNFVAEVELDPVGAPGVFTRRPISGFNQATGTLTLAYALPSSSLSKAYSIREPKWELNRYQGRILQITYPDMTTATTIIEWSDDHQLYWSTPLAHPIVAGCTYEILDPEIGTVWKREANGWSIPTGIDPRSARLPFGPVNFDDYCQKCLLPTMVPRYGLPVLGWYAMRDSFEQIYKCLNLLTATYHDSFGWSSRQNPAVEEKNIKTGGAHHTCFFGWEATIKNPADTSFDTVFPPCFVPDCPADYPGDPHEENGATPVCYTVFEFDQNFGCSAGDASLVRVFGYGTLSIGDGGYCPISSSTDFYVKTNAPTAPHRPPTDPLDPAYVATDPPCKPICSEVLTFTSEFGEPPATATVVYGSIFDDNGDVSEDVKLVCRRFRLFSSSSTSYQTGQEGLIDRRSGRLGSLNHPHWPPGPPLNEGGWLRTDNWAQGWVVNDLFAVTHWTGMDVLDTAELPPWWFFHGW